MWGGIDAKNVLMAVATYCAFGAAAFAQDETSKVHIFEKVDGTHCETIKAELDLIAERADEKSIIIIIARLGRKELSRALSRRRLDNLREYLKTTRAIPTKRIVSAEGARVPAPGQVEIYVGGELFAIFKMNRNKDFARGCSTA
jgi:hypothetical protein